MLSLSLLVPSTPRHFLSYSEDKYKIAFVSGNFTAAITKDMPRVVFGHAHPVLSPEFVVSSQKLYVFNDTNGDGVFSRSEAVYTSYLDSPHHVQWDMSTVEFGNESAGNEYAEVWMRANASLYDGIDDASSSPVISDWAIVTFHYRISEKATIHSNVLGTYVVSGGTEMTVGFSIELLKHTDSDGLVLELYLQGGGSTNMLLLREVTSAPAAALTRVSSGVDESAIGTNFTHRFKQTDRPCQDAYMAKEDGVIQAFYHFSTVPLNGSGADASSLRMNSSYYTDGAGMFLDQAYFITNRTDTVSEESSLGIDELGFNVSVKDWFQENLPMIMVVGGLIAAAILLTAFVFMYRRYRRTQSGGGSEPSEQRKPD